MSLRLRDNLHWCVCGGRVIFLDLEADRYCCLPSPAEAAFIRLAGGEAQPGDRERVCSLVARGMLIDDPASIGLGPAGHIPRPTGDLLEEPFPSPHFPDVLRAVASEVRWTWALRVKPLAKIAQEIEACAYQRGHPSPVADARLRRIVSASAAAGLILRAADRCLVRALSLHATCRRHGIYPHLVFGVRVNPFRAHCWVQLGDRVLIGDFEQVRLFTPIAALG